MSDPYGVGEFAACKHKSLRCEQCGARSNIFGWQAFTDYDDIRKQLTTCRELLREAVWNDLWAPQSDRTDLAYRTLKFHREQWKKAAAAAGGDS